MSLPIYGRLQILHLFQKFVEWHDLRHTYLSWNKEYKKTILEAKKNFNRNKIKTASSKCLTSWRAIEHEAGCCKEKIQIPPSSDERNNIFIKIAYNLQSCSRITPEGLQLYTDFSEFLTYCADSGKIFTWNKILLSIW